MQNFFRNVPLLALSQASMMSAMSLITATSALVGYELAPDKALATLPFAAILVATMLTSLPAAKLMQRIGRKPAFIFACFIGIIGGVLSTVGIIYQAFWVFLGAGIFIGIFNGFGTYYRFTAADIVPDEHKGRAISLVMAGGVLAAIIGPNLANHTQHAIPTAHFAGSYASIIALYILSIFMLSFLDMTPHHHFDESQHSQRARPLSIVMRQPQFIVALVCGMLGYGVMSFLMTATPLAMHHHAHPFSDTAFVIQWHVLGMFAPSFFTGHLIRRFGLSVILTSGSLFGILCVAINLTGTTVTHFFLALLFLGISWNFLFIGATTLLTQTYTPAEKFKAQAVNDFIVFTTVAVASLSAGAIQHKYGWQNINYAALPALMIILLSIVWLQIRQNAVQTSD
jgi:MFS family permease